MSENINSINPNSQPESKEKTGLDYLNGLIDELGLLRTEDLSEASAMVTQALMDPDVSPETRSNVWQEYATSAERAVEQSPDYARAQIASILHKATLFAAANNPLRYIEELDSAETYYENIGLTTIASDLDAEIRLVGETLQPSPELLVIKLKGIINDQNREYLRDLIQEGASLEDLIGDAYGMIIEEGSDPDEVLHSLGIIEL